MQLGDVVMNIIGLNARAPYRIRVLSQARSFCERLAKGH
jgi:hypothetical protein